MRDRYLFSADRKVTEYRDLLEITRGRARILTPSAAAFSWRWAMSVVYLVFYLSVASLLFVFLTIEPTPPWLRGWPAGLFVGLMWVIGFLLLFTWWDRRSLPMLADSPAQTTDVVLLGARSFGTYQDVRARTMSGEEFHLVVDARAPQFWEAVRLFEGKLASPG